MTREDIKALGRAKNGFAKQKKELMREWFLLHGVYQLLYIHDPDNKKGETRKEMGKIEKKLLDITM